MINEFEDQVEDLATAPPTDLRPPLPPPADAPRDAYDDAIDRIVARGPVDLRRAVIATGETSPDRAAEIRRLSLKYGQPPAVVERNYEAFTQRAGRDHPYAQITQQSPALATWAKDPTNAAIAKDDLPQLGAIEWLLTAPARGLWRGVNQNNFARLRAASIVRDLTRAEQAELEGYKFTSQARGGDVETSWFKGAIVGAAEQLPNFFGAGLAGLRLGIPAAVTAGAIGAAGTPLTGGLSVPVLFGAGLTAGTMVGAGQFTAELEAGLAYDELLGVRDEFGQPLDPMVAKAAALAAGAINGGLELVGMGAIVKTIPGLKKLGAAGVRAGIKEALRSPTVRAALWEATKSYGGALTTNVAEEVAQRAVTILAGELAKATGQTAAVPGQLERGNIDLFKQPRVTNAPDAEHPQGSISTVDSVSVNIDGQEVLLSQVTPDGRHVTPEEAIAEYKRTGKHLGKFETPAAATAFAKQLHADYEAGTYDQASKYRSAGSIGEDLLNEGLGALQSMALLPLPGATMQLAIDTQRAHRAQAAPAFFKALGQSVAQSKTATRLPAALQAFVEEATKDGPIETIYAPLATWNAYWQSQKLDPAEVAATVIGGRDAYEQATVTGADLAIPTARYAALLAGTEHNGFFATELRLGPDEMNGREVEAFRTEQAAAAAAETTAAAAASPVRQAVLEKAAAAGIPPSQATRWADLYEATFSTLAEIEGIQPADLFGSYGLSITQGEEAPARRARPARPAAVQPPIAGLAEPPVAPPPEGPAGPPAAPEGEPAVATGTEAETIPPADAEAAPGPVRAPSAANLAAQAEAAAARGTPFTPAEMAAGRAQQRRAAGVESEEDRDVTAAPGTGERLVDRAGEQPPPDQAGDAERAGDGDRARGGRVPAAVLPALDELFVRQPADANAARLTPEVTRELDRILQEMQEFPFVPHTWHWLEAGPKTGNVAGGAADLIPGSAGAAVYEDILAYAPVNVVTSGARKGQPAREASGARGRVAAAVAKALETRDIHNNLAEGAVRVAELRAAGQWKDLHRAELPPTWGVEAPVAFTDALSAAIDEELEPANLLADEAAISDADLEGDVDTSFNVDEFSQSLFDELEGPDPHVETLAEPAPQADVLETGEVQPRLPGDTGAVREQEVATPAMEAPFALTATIAKPRKGKQTELFQPAYHGSPHQFEKFSLHAIGTGQGAQSFGWGLYFASARELAERYRDQLSSTTDYAVAGGGRLPDWIGRALTSPEATAGPGSASYNRRVDEYLEMFKGRVAESQAALEEEPAQPWRYEDQLRNQQGVVDALERVKAGAAVTRPGRVYTVEIPENEDLLFWDKPVSEQSPQVQAALERLGYEISDVRYPGWAEAQESLERRLAEPELFDDVREALKEGLHYVSTQDTAAFRPWWLEHAGALTGWGEIAIAPQTGETVYNDLVARGLSLPSTMPGASRSEGARMASETLARVGVPGIRYLDGNSRAAGEGSSNYVIWDDSLIQITEYNQGPVGLTPESVQAWADELKARVGPDLVHFDLRLTRAGDIQLETIAVARGANRAGLGSTVMRELLRFADLNGKRIVLSPAEKGYAPPDAAVTSSYSRLVRFYQRFGFVRNAGRHHDALADGGMYREPTLPTPTEYGQPLFHGSPHDFDRFSLEHVGTGEGAAAYGWGLYFAENPAVAAGYHERLSGNPSLTELKLGSMRIGPFNNFDYSRRASDSTLENIRASLAEDLLIDEMALRGAPDPQAHVLEVLDAKIAGYSQEDYAGSAAAGAQLRAELAKPGAVRATFEEAPGGVYKVDIPDDAIARMLDWDAPIKDQPAPVRELVRAALKEQGYLGPQDNGPRQLTAAFKAYTNEHGGMAQGPTGELAYHMIVTAETAKLNAPLLAQRAVIDAKYPDLKRYGYRMGPESAAAQRFSGATAKKDFQEFVRLTGAIEKNKDEGAKRASRRLAAAGVPGLRYLDQGSRDTGAGTRNVVVFDDAIITLTHKDGTPVTATERTEYFQTVPAPTFYSRLTRAVQDSKQTKAPGAQWKATIRNAKIGINKDEFAIARVDDLEDSRTYTKQEVLDYLEANQVVVEDVTLEGQGEPPEPTQEQIDRIYDRMVDEALESLEENDEGGESAGKATVRYDADEEQWEAFVGGEDIGRWFDTEDEALEAADAARETRQEELDEEHQRDLRERAGDSVSWSEAEEEARRALEDEGGGEGGVQYAEYTLPGAVEGSYREVFLTVPQLPRVGGTPTITLHKIDQTEDSGIYIIKVNGQTWQMQSGEVQRLRFADGLSDADKQAMAESAWRAAQRQLGWEDGHEAYSGISNPIVRLRFNEHLIDDKRVLFLEEVQPPQPDQQPKMPPLFVKNWREIAFKWALHHAATNGFDAVAYTPGHIQADRYSLEKEVKSIVWIKTAGTQADDPAGVRQSITIHTVRGVIGFYIDEAGKVAAFGASAQAEPWIGAPLEDIVGKEIAATIIGSRTRPTQPGVALQGEGELKGEGLKIGGEGLKRLYDVDFKNVVQGIPAIKKHGGKVSTAALEQPSRRPVRGERATGVTDADDGEGGRYYRMVLDNGTQAGAFPTFATAQEAVVAHNAALQRSLQQTIAVPILELTPEMKTALAGGQALFQGAPAPPTYRRGALRFGPDRQMNIALFARADRSTFLHESGHFFLEVLGDLVDRLAAKDPATLTDRQRQALADYATLLGTFGVSSREEIGVEQHEQFARSFEAYLMTGQAPSLALRRTFATFRAWLLRIYQSLTALNVELSPEVTGLFDRMLASNAAIAEAEAQRNAPPLFATAAAAGMTEAQFGLYRATLQDAHRTAIERLDAKLAAEVHREQTADWKAHRDAAEAEVRAEVYARPVYRALSAIQHGTFPDGEPLVEGLETPPLKMSKTMLVEQFGPERLQRLPRPYVYSAAGGMDPETVAGLLGYSSADQLLTDLENAPPMGEVIRAEVRARMAAQYGSLLTDGSLPTVAKGAVSNEDRDLVLRAELRALGQLRRTVAPFVAQAEQAGAAALAGEQRERAYERRWFEAEAKLKLAQQRGEDQATIDALTDEVQNLRRKARGGAATIRAAVPPAGVLRETARLRLAGTPIRQIRPEVFWSAARRAAQRALDAAARQDFDGAIVAKQQELINVHLYREAERVLEDVAARVRFAQDLTRPVARGRIGKAGGHYLDQIDGILDRYSFAPVSQKVLDRRSSLRKFVEGLESQGLPVDLPESLLDEARRMPYQELPVAEFINVTDGLTQLVHLARLKNKMLRAAERRAYATVRDGLVDSIRSKNKITPRPLEFTKAGETWRDVANYFASHMKLSQLVFALDGAVDGGPMWEAFARPINAAADAQETRFTEAGSAYWAILERFYPGRERLAFSEQLYIPAIDASLSKEARLALAMNWGNETSRDRVLADPIRQWTRPQVEAILATLDQRDWTFVQAHWDFLNTFWEEIAAKSERMTGVRPEKVEAVPVQTAFGTFPGGYHPLAYDHRLSARAGQHQAMTEAKLAVAGAYLRSTTRRGHTIARVQNVTLPIRLDFSVTTRHLEQVIHDLTHHEMLVDTTRLLRDPAIATAIYDTHGDQVYDKLARLLQDIATGDAAANGKRSIIDNGADFLRTRTQVAGLALNLWTGLQQPLGLFNGMDRVGVRWVAKGMGRWLRDAVTMESTTAWINQVSPMMRTRTRTATADLRDVRRTLREPGGWFDRLVRTVSQDRVTQQTFLDSYMWHIGVAQRIADVPTWLGQYEKSMAAGEPEDRAIALADQAVLDSQGGGHIKDLAEVQRGGPTAKLFMTFASYGVTVVNATARNVSILSHARTPAGALRFIGHLGLLYAAPALLGEILRCGTGRTNCDDPATYLGKVGGEMITGAMNGLIGVREAAGAVNIALGLEPGARGYEGPATTRPFQVIYNLAQQLQQGELDESLEKAAFAASGILFNYPAAQVQRSVDGWNALMEGRTTNPAAVLFGPPPKAKAQ